MSNEKPLTQNYNTNNLKIFHPFLLNFYDITKKNTHAIMPQLISSNTNTIEDYKIISNNDSISIDTNIDLIFGNNKYFLMYNFNIKNIDDIFELLNNLINGKNNIQTIDIILNLIINVFIDEIDDIYTDKFIIFYTEYFKKFFEITIEYKQIFKIIRIYLEKAKIEINKAKEQNKEKENISNRIHSDIINNILSK